MKRKGILGMAVVAVIGLSGCGQKELSLVSDQIEVELGSKIDETVTTYVELDADAAEQASVDFSAVDVMKAGTYTATVTYNEQTASFAVVVEDTTAPAVEAVESVSVVAGESLYTKDVLTSVTELSGAVETGFQMPEDAAKGDTEENLTIESTEETESVVISETETGTETENVNVMSEESFLLNDVTCENAQVIISEMGEHDLIVVVADSSGNSIEVPVHVVVGIAPIFEGVEDITATVGEEDVNYLDGVTATDCNGSDITGQIVCDTSAVNLKVEGTYDIVYTVADENGFQAEAKASVMVEKEKAGSSSKKTTAGTDSSTKKSGTSDNSNKSSEANNTTNNNISGGSSTTSNTGGSSNSTSGGSNSTSGGSSPAPSTDTTNNNTSGGNADISGNNNVGNQNTPAEQPSQPVTPDSGNGESNVSPTPDAGNTTDNWWENGDWGEAFDPSTNPEHDGPSFGGIE